MRIKECLTTIVNREEKEMKYFYRLTEKNFFDGQAYGIEIERQDLVDGVLVNIERDAVSTISNNEDKVRSLLNLLFDNEVSPIHLIDIIGEYVDAYVEDFDMKHQLVASL